MPRTPENLPRHELIGLQVKVLEASNENYIGISGEVLDETRDTMNIDGKTVEKKSCVFVFDLPSGEEVKIKGKIIAKRPEERLKMKLPDKWKN